MEKLDIAKEVDESQGQSRLSLKRRTKSILQDIESVSLGPVVRF